jgi:glutamine synthetase
LEASALFGSAVPSLVDVFVKMKRREIERFEAHVTDWETREYMWHL